METNSSEEKSNILLLVNFFASRQIIVKMGMIFFAVVTVVYYLYKDENYDVLNNQGFLIIGKNNSISLILSIQMCLS